MASSIIPVPSLSAGGWIRSPAEKADTLLAHFFASDKYQTALYDNNVANIQWLVQQYGSNIVSLVSEIRSALEVYLGRYYPTVNVDVSSDDVINHQTNRITINIYCQVTDGGKQYSFGRLITTLDSKITTIAKLNNG